MEDFLLDKSNVSMSSHKTDPKAGLPIYYLQDHKSALWKKYSELYPDGMRCTAFMSRLESGQFLYRDNLGGLCIICNEYGYEIFSEITKLIENYVNNSEKVGTNHYSVSMHNLIHQLMQINITQKGLVERLQFLRRYLKKDFSSKLLIDSTGKACHSSCICHCLSHALGGCNSSHPDICPDCKDFFLFFELLRKNLSSEYYDIIENYEKQLIYFLAHHTRKTYLNFQFKTNLQELDQDGALLIVDFKMRILPQSS